VRQYKSPVSKSSQETHPLTASRRNSWCLSEQLRALAECGTTQHTTSGHPNRLLPTALPLHLGQGRVQRHAAGRFSPTRQGIVVIRPQTRDLERRPLEALWRLPRTRKSHLSKQIPTSTYTRLLPPPFQLHHFFQNRTRTGLPPDPCSPRTHPKDGTHHIFWPFRIYFHVLRTMYRHPTLTTFQVRYH